MSQPELPTLVLSTRNRNKTEQIRQALAGRYIVRDMSDAQFADLPEVEETGVTFEENAVLKAVTISALLPAEVLVLADDSGLCVDALDGAPGVYSARYAGPGATDGDNNAKLLAALEGLENRGAHYISVLALAAGGSVLHITEGRVDGTLLNAPRGSLGFGYDPLFVPSGRGDDRTFAELTNEEKLPFNHRGRALAAMTEFLAGRSVG